MATRGRIFPVLPFLLLIFNVSRPQDGNRYRTVYTNACGTAVSKPATLHVLWVDVSIDLSHKGNFKQGDVGDTYTIKVTNVGTAAARAGADVSILLPPSGLEMSGISGIGWTCNLIGLNCSRTDMLAPAASYPDITLTVNVQDRAPRQ